MLRPSATVIALWGGYIYANRSPIIGRRYTIYKKLANESDKINSVYNRKAQH